MDSVKYIGMDVHKDTISIAVLAGIRGSLSSANFRGSRSPASMARIMACPVSPLTSVITFANCTFICVNAFCIR